MMFRPSGSKVSTDLSFDGGSGGDDSPTVEPFPAAEAFLCSCNAPSLEIRSKEIKQTVRACMIKKS